MERKVPQGKYFKPSQQKGYILMLVIDMQKRITGIDPLSSFH